VPAQWAVIGGLSLLSSCKDADAITQFGADMARPIGELTLSREAQRHNDQIGSDQSQHAEQKDVPYIVARHALAHAVG
jgi:hypothetical protein